MQKAILLTSDANVIREMNIEIMKLHDELYGGDDYEHYMKWAEKDSMVPRNNIAYNNAAVVQDRAQMIAQVKNFFARENIYKLLKSAVSYLVPHRSDVILVLNHGGGSYTDDKKVVIGLPEIFWGKTPEQMFIALRALVGHECQHINSSNFELFKRFIEDVGKYLKDKYGISQGQQIGKQLANSVEDGRIEKILGNKLAGYVRYLKYLNGTIWEHQPVVGNSELQDFLYTITTISVTGLHPKGFSDIYTGTELETTIDSIHDDIIDGINAVTCAQCMKICWDILYKIEGYLAKLLEKQDAEDQRFLNGLPQQMEFSDSDESETNGSSKTVTVHFKPENKDDKKDDKGNEDTTEAPEKKGQSKPKENKGKNSSGEEPNKKEEAEKQKETNSSKTSKGESGKDEDENSTGNGASQKKEEEESHDKDNDSNGEGDGSSDEAGEGDREDDDSSPEEDKTSEQGGKDNEKEDENQGESNDGSSNDKNTEGEMNNSSKDDDIQENDGEQSDNSKEPSNNNTTSSNNSSNQESLVDEELRAMEEDLVNEAKKKISDEASPKKQKEEEATKLSEQDVREIEEKYKDESCSKFTEEKGLSLNAPLPENLKINGSKLKRELERILRNKEVYSLKNQRKGILDDNVLYRVGLKDYGVFKKNGVPSKADFVVYGLQDGSGSMTCDYKQLYAASALAILEEGTKGLIPFKATSFYTSWSGVTHYVIKDFNETKAHNYSWNFNNQRRASGGNKDGYSIRIATKELEKRPEKDKILIVLSDGLPSNYNGRIAGELDVREAVKEARKKGIVVIAIMFGTEEFRNAYIDNYKYMYDKNIIACDPKDIPQQLTKVFKAIIAKK